jgi:hypothetical protein
MEPIGALGHLAAAVGTLQQRSRHRISAEVFYHSLESFCLFPVLLQLLILWRAFTPWWMEDIRREGYAGTGARRPIPEKVVTDDYCTGNVSSKYTFRSVRLTYPKKMLTVL